MLVIMESRRRLSLATALVLALMLPTCELGSTPEDVRREANTRAVRDASASAASQLNGIIARLVEQTPALRPVATSTSDTCHAGDTNGSFPHDPYRLRCTRHETRYFGVRGELPDVVRQVHAGAKKAGLMTLIDARRDGVRTPSAGNGEIDGGQLLGPPDSIYVAPGYDGRLHIAWSQASDPRPSAAPLELRWPVVFQDDRPVDVDSLWNGPLRGQRHLIMIVSTVTYHEVPWQ
ncbi:hypothetical protein GCE86_07745 [Micromonospora terminaliae]|uniref:Uncharacterized protein n=1 Tax=Micromonospora terminaliae TaxID=1914461 RepID=A0AAJ2ZHR3_9ACTN|nr:hypothetical protein [Micromonospora terminaliae]NES30282.1 hypothetical protein [Micromonospora terminaliae]QGL46957.1 hypothetical protein GCE86_07745 [Micromonospora terminaliae]